MKQNKFQLLSALLAVASLVLGFVQGQVDAKCTERYIEERIDQALSEKDKSPE